MLYPAVDCGSPKPPFNGYILSYTSTVENASVIITCQNGLQSPHTDRNLRIAVCSQDGNWEPDPIYICTKVSESGDAC